MSDQIERLNCHLAVPCSGRLACRREDRSLLKSVAVYKIESLLPQLEAAFGSCRLVSDGHHL